MAAKEEPDWAEADGEGEDQVRGYLGPYPVLKGTLTAAMKEDIYDQTGCSVNVRGRQQWEHRCLTIVGPPSRLVTAKKLAETAIASTVRGDGVRADGSVSKTAARAEKGSGKGPVPAPKTPPKATPPPASKVKTETEPQEAAPGPKAATKTEPAKPKQAAPQPKAAAKAYPAELKQAAPPPKAAAKAEPAPKEAAPRSRAAAKAEPRPCPKAGPRLPPPPQAAWQSPPAAAGSSWDPVPELQYQLNVAMLRISTLEQSMLQVQQIQGLQGTGLAALQSSAHACEDRLARLEHERARSRSPHERARSRSPRALVLEERGRVEESGSSCRSSSSTSSSSSQKQALKQD